MLVIVLYKLSNERVSEAIIYDEGNLIYQMIFSYVMLMFTVLSTQLLLFFNLKKKRVAKALSHSFKMHLNIEQTVYLSSIYLVLLSLLFASIIIIPYYIIIY